MRGIAHDLWRKRQAVSEHSPKCHSVNSAYHVLFIVCSGFYIASARRISRVAQRKNTRCGCLFVGGAVIT